MTIHTYARGSTAKAAVAKTAIHASPVSRFARGYVARVVAIETITGITRSTSMLSMEKSEAIMPAT